MNVIQRTSIKVLLPASFISAELMAPALSGDRTDKHALALSHRYGDYTKRGNLADGETVIINTPEGSVTCTGGNRRKYTGKNGPEGDLRREQRPRICHFN